MLSLRASEEGVTVLARTRTGLMLSHVLTPIAGRAAALAYVHARCLETR